MTNECIQCGEVWKVRRARLDYTDRSNLALYGQLYSLCEDCSKEGEVISVDYADYEHQEKSYAYGDEVWK